jgi:membrane protein DedA with SNARE-associated domain
LDRRTIKIAIGAVIGTVLGTGTAFGICIVHAYYRATKLLLEEPKPALVSVGVLNWNLLILGALIGCCIGLLLGWKIGKRHKQE